MHMQLNINSIPSFILMCLTKNVYKQYTKFTKHMYLHKTTITVKKGFHEIFKENQNTYVSLVIVYFTYQSYQYQQFS